MSGGNKGGGVHENSAKLKRLLKQYENRTEVFVEVGVFTKKERYPYIVHHKHSKFMDKAAAKIADNFDDIIEQAKLFTTKSPIVEAYFLGEIGAKILKQTIEEEGHIVTGYMLKNAKHRIKKK